MIVFERFGQTFEIEDDDWKNLRERFNPKNAVEFLDGWEINVPCSLCMKSDSFCPRCPFYSFEVKEHGDCGGFLNKLFLKKKFAIQKYKVAWSKGNNIPARRQLNRMQKIMDEIEVENKVRKG